MAGNKEDWRTVDIDSELGVQARELYNTMKAAYKAYAVAKAAFEFEMQLTTGAGLPDNTELKFGYMFGKLSIAIGPKREAKAKASTSDSGKSLSDWLRDKAASGDRS